MELLTGIISDKTYYHLEKNRLLPEEQKGSRRKCQGTKDQLAIDRCILQNCRKRKTNLSMGLIKQNMNKWKTNLYADGKLLGSVTRSHHYCL